MQVLSWVGKKPWRRKCQPIPVFLPGKSHGQRSLVGYSPWGHKRLGHDLTKHQQQLFLFNSFPGAASGKEPTCQCTRCKREMQVWSLGWEDPLEEGMATHSSILAWEVPWTEEPGHSPQGRKESDMTEVTTQIVILVKPT